MLEDLPELVQLTGLGLFLALGLLYCFIGYRLFRFLAGLAGLIAGAVISGYLANEYFGLAARESFLVAVFGAAAGAVLLYLLHQVGVFIFGATLGVILVILSATAYDADPMFPALLLAALAGSVLALARKRVVLVLCTAIAGAATVAMSAFFIIRETDAAEWLLETPKVDYPPYWWVLPGLALGLLGIVIQFLLTARSKEEGGRPGIVTPQIATEDAAEAMVEDGEVEDTGDEEQEEEEGALELAEQIAAALADPERTPTPTREEINTVEMPAAEAAEQPEGAAVLEEPEATGGAEGSAGAEPAAELEEPDPPATTDVIERAFSEKPTAEDAVRADDEWAERAEQRLADAMAQIQAGAAAVESPPEDVEALISQANRPSPEQMLGEPEFTDPEAELASSMHDAEDELASSAPDDPGLTEGADFPDVDAATVRRTVSEEIAIGIGPPDETTVQTGTDDPVPVTFPDEDSATARHVLAEPVPPPPEQRPGFAEDDGAEISDDFADMDAPTRQARPDEVLAGWPQEPTDTTDRRPAEPLFEITEPTAQRPSKPEIMMGDVTAQRPSKPEIMMAEVTAKTPRKPDGEESTNTEPLTPSPLEEAEAEPPEQAEGQPDKPKDAPPEPAIDDVPDWPDDE